jgi:phosphoribosylformylglycinamidine synthase
VTGGNVSFYNETKGRAIYPTPVIGMLGVLDSYTSSIGVGLVQDGHQIVLLGATDPGDLGGSEYAKVINGVVSGTAPKLDLQAEQSLHAFLYTAAQQSMLASCHDLSHGGAAVALAECALAGRRGFSVDVSDISPGAQPHAALFSESPSRALISCAEEHAGALAQLAAHHRVPFRLIGVAGGPSLDFGAFALLLDDLERVFESTLPNILSASMDR